MSRTLQKFSKRRLKISKYRPSQRSLALLSSTIIRPIRIKENSSSLMTCFLSITESTTWSKSKQDRFFTKERSNPFLKPFFLIFSLGYPLPSMLRMFQATSREATRIIWTIFAITLISRWETGLLSIFLWVYNYLLSTIKIARVSQPIEQVSTNITASLHNILSHILTPPVKIKHIR